MRTRTIPALLAAISVVATAGTLALFAGRGTTPRPAPTTPTTLADWLAVPVPPGGTVDATATDSRTYNYPGVPSSTLAGFYRQTMTPGRDWNGHAWCDQMGLLGQAGGIVWSWMTANRDELITVNVADDGHGNGFVIVHDDVGDAPCHP